MRKWACLTYRVFSESLLLLVVPLVVLGSLTLDETSADETSADETSADETSADEDFNWPQFRGRSGAGVMNTNVSTEWDAESGKNIDWKVRIPGIGHSSPIIWNGHIYLTTAVNSVADEPELSIGWVGGTGEAAIDDGEWSWQLLCLDQKSGEVLWKRTARQGIPIIKRHIKATHANCTPATDGKYLVAFFGSEGLFCYDMQGKLIWEKDFGRLHSGPYDAEELEWGFAASPVIHDGKVIVQCDCLNTAFIAVLDLATGEEIRRIERDEVATWSTPAIVQSNGTTQIVCNGFRQMSGYDLATGERLWWLAGGGDVPVPTPLFAHGIILLTNAHGRTAVYAIDPNSRGDLSPRSEDDKDVSKEASKDTSKLVWFHRRDGSYMPTPIVVGDSLYTCNDNGRLAVRKVKDGQSVYRERVGGGANFTASAVATPTHIYLSDEVGRTYVIRPGDQLETVAENDLGEPILATPAIGKDQLIVRTLRHLISIRED
jgi:outer membrane protein assembly factor BamB